MAKDELISFREFARRMGTTVETVSTAVATGKIKSVDRTNPKRPKLSFKKAKEEWAKNFTPRKIQNQKLADNLAGKEGAAPEQSKVDESGEIVIDPSASYQEQIRVKEHFKAKAAQLEYQELRGSLVNKDAAYKEWYAAGQSVRSALQGIPDKIIDQLLAAENRIEAHAILTREITEALEVLSTTPKLK